MTAVCHRLAANVSLRAAVAVYVILLLPRTVIPLLRWTGADAMVLGWMHIGLDYGQLAFLIAWWTRGTGIVVRVAAAVWAVGLIILAVWVPHVSTYTLVYAGQAAVVAAIVRQAFTADGAADPMGRARPLLDAAIFLSAFPVMVLSSLAAGLMREAWPPPGGGSQDQLSLLGIDTLGKAIVRMMVTSVLEEGASALLVVGLLRRGTGLGPICVIGAATRIVYHTYMGPSAVPIALMACSMIALYWCYGRLLPLILAHEYFDLATLLPHPDPLLWTAAGAGVLVIYTVLVVYLADRRDRLRTRDLGALMKIGCGHGAAG